MTFLALEFSSDVRSVAVVRAAQTLGTARASGGRSTRAFALIEGALREAGLEREAVDGLVLGIGPGSYTGIRVAIAIAQGWQLALGSRLLGIGAAPCLAEQARLAGYRGRIHVAIDAQRGDLYHASFDLSDAGAHPVTALQLTTPDAVQQRAGPNPIFAGAETAPLIAGAAPLNPDAAVLGRLADGRRDFVLGSQLQPIYLRETTFVKAPPPRVVLP